MHGFSLSMWPPALPTPTWVPAPPSVSFPNVLEQLCSALMKLGVSFSTWALNQSSEYQGGLPTASCARRKIPSGDERSGSLRQIFYPSSLEQQPEKPTFFIAFICWLFGAPSSETVFPADGGCQTAQSPASSEVYKFPRTKDGKLDNKTSTQCDFLQLSSRSITGTRITCTSAVW